jgi:hypothetical protein
MPGVSPNRWVALLGRRSSRGGLTLDCTSRSLDGTSKVEPPSQACAGCDSVSLSVELQVQEAPIAEMAGAGEFTNVFHRVGCGRVVEADRVRVGRPATCHPGDAPAGNVAGSSHLRIVYRTAGDARPESSNSDLPRSVEVATEPGSTDSTD